jgi:hypothetical protein
VGRLGVHRVHDALEAPREQVPEDLVADAAAGAAGAHDRDRTWAEDRLQGGHVGAALPGAHRFEKCLVLVDRKRDVDDTVLHPGLHGEPDGTEHVEHAPVLGQCLGDEAAYAVVAGDGGEMFEQQGGDASALVLVVDHERHFGLVTALAPVVPDDGDDVVLKGRYQGDPVPAIDVGEVLDLFLAEARVRGEEAQVNGVG